MTTKWTKQEVNIWNDGFLMGMLWASYNTGMADSITWAGLPDSAARAWMEENASKIEFMRTSGFTDTAMEEDAIPPSQSTVELMDKTRELSAKAATEGGCDSIIRQLVKTRHNQAELRHKEGMWSMPDGTIPQKDSAKAGN